MQQGIPNTMIWLRETLESASISYNKEGELVKQAHFERWIAGRLEQYIVALRTGSALFYILRWNDTLQNGEGDFEGYDARIADTLDQLYEMVDHEKRYILDSQRWKTF